jgi:hypothetical protein
VAILQDHTVSLETITGLPIEGAANVRLLTRLREMRFVVGPPPRMEFVFEPFVSGVTGKKMEDVVIAIGAEPQPPDPPEDIVDPETGEVLVAAGTVRPALPSLDEVNAMRLPGGSVVAETFGQLIDTARRQIYLTMIGLMPQWQDGTEG